MLHQTTMPWLPERMRRLIFSAICSSGNSANRLKPTSFGINILPNQDRLWRRGRRNAQICLTKIPWERPDSQGITVAAPGSTLASVAGAASVCNSLVAHVRITAYNAKAAGSDRPHHLDRARKTCPNVEKRESPRVQEPF